MARRGLGLAVLIAGLAFGVLAVANTRYAPPVVAFFLLGGWLGLVLGGLALMLRPASSARVLFAVGLGVLAVPGALAIWTYVRVPPQWAFFGFGARVHLTYDALLVLAVVAAVVWAVKPTRAAGRVVATLLVASGVLAIYTFSGPLLNAFAGPSATGLLFGVVSAAFGIAVLALGIGSFELDRDHAVAS